MPLTQPLCALMEVLRWKGNHEIFCHSPPFCCSSVTSMSLSGRVGEKTACQTILFYNVWYSESSQLISLIIMFSTVFCAAVYSVYLHQRTMKGESAVFPKTVIEIWFSFILRQKKNHKKTVQFTCPKAGCWNLTSSLLITPAAMLQHHTNNPQPLSLPPADSLGSSELLCQMTVYVGVCVPWDILFQLNLYWYAQHKWHKASHFLKLQGLKSGVDNSTLGKKKGFLFFSPQVCCERVSAWSRGVSGRMSWVVQRDMRRTLWRLLQEELQSERWGGRKCGCLLTGSQHTTNTLMLTQNLAQLSMPQNALSHATIGYSTRVCACMCVAHTVWLGNSWMRVGTYVM